jgi:Tol biopolymer transport system component
VNTNQTGSGNGDSYTPVVSGDGHRVLFRSTGNNLAPGPYASQGENLFYRDLQSGTTWALTGYGVRSSAMTPEGRWVVFVGALNTPITNLYVWDSQLATRVYTNALAAPSPVSISANGSRVAYVTNSQLYAADWTTRTIWQVGPMAASSRAGMSFSADGRFLTYASKTAQMLVDTNGTYDVYLYDLQTLTKLLVSQRYGAPEAANDASDCPDISPDGRVVAYRSVASNLVPGDDNGVPDVFVYERLTGTTTLLSVNRFGTGPADSWSYPPLFSGDGSQVIFQSWASDLVGCDFNHGGDVFGYALFYAPLYVEVVPGAPGPTLSWPTQIGKTYRVQYLDSLGVGNWQEAGGSVTIFGQRAYFTDPAPSATRRFYRVVAN